MSEQETPINWKKIMLRVFIGLIVLAAISGGCSYVNKKMGLDDDHQIEEIIEQHIENQTG
jgi:hypothetical protein